MSSRRAKLISTTALAGALMLLAQFAIAANDACGTVPMEHATCASQCIAQDDNALPTVGAALPPGIATMSFLRVPAWPPACPERDAPGTGRTLQVLYCSYQK